MSAENPSVMQSPLMRAIRAITVTGQLSELRAAERTHHAEVQARLRAGEQLNTFTITPVRGIFTAREFMREPGDQNWNPTELTKEIAGRTPFTATMWARFARGPNLVFSDEPRIPDNEGKLPSRLWSLFIPGYEIAAGRVDMQETTPGGRLVARHMGGQAVIGMQQ